MKPDVHPPYGPVAFRDRSTGHVVLARSTLVARATARTLDSEGRVDRFRRRYGARS